MSIINRLKKILGIKEEQLYLPVGKEKNNSTKDFRGNLRMQQLPKNSQEPTLEECMEEFIKQYLLQEKINPESQNKPYNAFRRIFCNQEEEVRA